MNSESFSVSTETRRQTLNRYGAYFFFLFLSAMVVTMPVWTQWLDDRDSQTNPPTQDDIWMALSCIGLGLSIFLIAPIGMFFQRGEWKFDAVGIGWRPLGRKERYMKWEDVDRVHLIKRTKCRLRSKQAEIGIYWHNWPKEERLRTVNFIDGILGPHFAFEERQKIIQRSWYYSLARVAIIPNTVYFLYILSNKVIADSAGAYTKGGLFVIMMALLLAYGFWEFRKMEKLCWVWRKTPQK